MKTLRKTSLVDNVAEELRHLIVAGQIPPGGFLPSRKELAARFGVGVSTVHEAIQALAAVGLVESHPGKETWVRGNAFDTLIHPAAVETRLGTLQPRHMYEARFAIEVALTELAAARATPKDIEYIWAAIRRMEAAIDDEAAFIDADISFHLAVARAGHNELLEQFYHVSHRLLLEVITGLVRLPHVMEIGTALQRAIAEAITQHDPAAARQAALDQMASIDGMIDQLETSREAT